MRCRTEPVNAVHRHATKTSRSSVKRPRQLEDELHHTVTSSYVIQLRADHFRYLHSFISQVHTPPSSQQDQCLMHSCTATHTHTQPYLLSSTVFHRRNEIFAVIGDGILHRVHTHTTLFHQNAEREYRGHKHNIA